MNYDLLCAWPGESLTLTVLGAGITDPTSGQPEIKHTPARVSPYRGTWSGFMLDRGAWDAPEGVDLIWRRIPQDARRPAVPRSFGHRPHLKRLPP